jgi:hypothetical protein
MHRVLDDSPSGRVFAQVPVIVPDADLLSVPGDYQQLGVIHLRQSAARRSTCTSDLLGRRQVSAYVGVRTPDFARWRSRRVTCRKMLACTNIAFIVMVDGVPTNTELNLDVLSLPFTLRMTLSRSPSTAVERVATSSSPSAGGREVLNSRSLDPVSGTYAAAK